MVLRNVIRRLLRVGTLKTPGSTLKRNYVHEWPIAGIPVTFVLRPRRDRSWNIDVATITTLLILYIFVYASFLLICRFSIWSYDGFQCKIALIYRLFYDTKTSLVDIADESSTRRFANFHEYAKYYWAIYLYFVSHKLCHKTDVICFDRDTLLQQPNECAVAQPTAILIQSGIMRHISEAKPSMILSIKASKSLEGFIDDKSLSPFRTKVLHEKKYHAPHPRPIVLETSTPFDTIVCRRNIIHK